MDNRPSQDVREALVRSIYALIDDAQQWPHALELLDQLTGTSDETDPLTAYPDSIASLLPHLNHSIKLLEHLSELEIRNSHADRLMNHIPMGIVIIKADASILTENSCAAELLTHVRATHQKKALKFEPAVHQTAFSLACREVLGGGTGKSVRMGELHLWISPHGPEPNRQLAIFLGHQSYRRNIHIPSLINLYGLTRKEAMVAAELCNGRASLEEVCASLDININTVRSHLKQIYAKTNTNRQSELVKMLLINPSLVLQGDRKTDKLYANLRHSQLAHLPSGRTLSWAEYGDPRGRPILLCHAITGGRLIIPRNEKILKKLHLRLVVPDRAGYGISTPTTQGMKEQWLEDMRLFIPQVASGSLTLIGHSAGGAHAMTLATESPELVDHLCLVSSLAPLLQKDDIEEILPMNRMLIKLARSNKVAARGFLKLALKAAIKNPDGYFKLILNSIPDMDREVIENPELKQLLLDGFAETTRQGIEHIIEEMMYIACQWNVDATDIRCPVNIWHGREDKHAPFPLIQRFATTLPEQMHTHWIDGAGHYMLFYHWDAILTGIANRN